jgi:membrane complex biogenesis BtpA family protein
MAIVVDHIVRSVEVMVGVNVLRNDCLSGLAVAAASGAAFIRVNVLSGVYATDQGMLTGQPRQLSTRRAAVAPGVKIAADVHVKHAQPISQPNIALAAEETAYRAGADALIVSGDATGRAADLESAAQVVEAVPDRPLWIGSGVTPETVGDCLCAAGAVIVGSCLKKDGKATSPLDAGRVEDFMAAVRGC